MILKGFAAPDAAAHPAWSPAAWDLGGFGEVLGRPRTWRVVGLTFLQAGLVACHSDMLPHDVTEFLVNSVNRLSSFDSEESVNAGLNCFLCCFDCRYKLFR